MSSRYLAGLDLGQAQDPTALVIAERMIEPPYDPSAVELVHEQVEVKPPWYINGQLYRAGESVQQVHKKLRLADGSLVDVPTGGDVVHYRVRHIQRFKLGTSYPAIVEEVSTLLSRPELGTDVTLIVDGTGVGRPVVDLFHQKRRSFDVVPVLITGGDTPSQIDGWHHVPKRELIARALVALETGRLKIGQFPETAVLTSELQTYRVKKTNAANEIFEARSGAHDDLVLALALACWYGERSSVQIFF